MDKTEFITPEVESFFIDTLLGYRDKSLNKKTYVSEEYKNCFLRVSAHPQFRDRVEEKLKELSDDIVQTTNN